MYDDDKDGKMQRDEVPKVFEPYFDMMDRNGDGEVDMKEATKAKKEFIQRQVNSN